MRLWRRKGVPVPSAGRGRGSRMAGPGRAPAASSARGWALRLSLHREKPAMCALPARDAGRTGQAGHAAAATSTSLAWPDPSTGGETRPGAPPERAWAPGGVQGPRALLSLRARDRPAAFFSCGGRAGPARGRKAKQPPAPSRGAAGRRQGPALTSVGFNINQSRSPRAASCGGPLLRGSVWELGPTTLPQHPALHAALQPQGQRRGAAPQHGGSGITPAQGPGLPHGTGCSPAKPAVAASP